MRIVLSVLGGVALGFTAAHFINKTEKGREFFARVNGVIDGFTEAVKDGYDARTQELIDAIDRGEADARRR